QTGFARDGDAILLIGETKRWLGQSAYAHDLCGRTDGAPPPVDLAAERRNGDFVRRLILSGRASAAHDLADGGLAVALAEMALSGDRGAEIAALPSGPGHATLFGEDQARYLVTVQQGEDAAEVVRAGASAGVAILAIGRVGGDALILPGEAPILLTELRKAHEAPLPAFMAGDDNALSCAFSTQVS
ncbi:MAG: AIR synthase-related protein, partial [Methylocystis sp.]|nr:AIR synthase-related protein [Methylocystis sp.]